MTALLSPADARFMQRQIEAKLVGMNIKSNTLILPSACTVITKATAVSRLLFRLFPVPRFRQYRRQRKPRHPDPHSTVRQSPSRRQRHAWCICLSTSPKRSTCVGVGSLQQVADAAALLHKTFSSILGPPVHRTQRSGGAQRQAEDHPHLRETAARKMVVLEAPRTRTRRILRACPGREEMVPMDEQALEALGVAAFGVRAGQCSRRLRGNGHQRRPVHPRRCRRPFLEARRLVAVLVVGRCRREIYAFK